MISWRVVSSGGTDWGALTPRQRAEVRAQWTLGTTSQTVPIEILKGQRWECVTLDSDAYAPGVLADGVLWEHVQTITVGPCHQAFLFKRTNGLDGWAHTAIVEHGRVRWTSGGDSWRKALEMLLAYGMPPCHGCTKIAQWLEEENNA